MAQLAAVFDWSAVACTLRRPQSVALAPEYSCSFCCTASGEFGDDAALGDSALDDPILDGATGPADFLAVRRKTATITTTRRTSRIAPKFFMTSVIVNLRGEGWRNQNQERHPEKPFNHSGHRGAQRTSSIASVSSVVQAFARVYGLPVSCRIRSTSACRYGVPSERSTS